MNITVAPLAHWSLAVPLASQGLYDTLPELTRVVPHFFEQLTLARFGAVGQYVTRQLASIDLAAGRARTSLCYDCCNTAQTQQD